MMNFYSSSKSEKLMLDTFCDKTKEKKELLGITFLLMQYFLGTRENSL